MNNFERFEKAVNFAAVDRVMTYDFIDNREVLQRYGGFDAKSTYCFEELVEINARALRSMGLDITRYIHDPLNHWMGSKIKNRIRFLGVDPDGWEVSQKVEDRLDFQTTIQESKEAGEKDAAAARI